MKPSHAYTDYCTLENVGCANADCPNARSRKAEAHINQDGLPVTDCCLAPPLDEDGFIYDAEAFELQHVDQKPWLERVK